MRDQHRSQVNLMNQSESKSNAINQSQTFAINAVASTRSIGSESEASVFTTLRRVSWSKAGSASENGCKATSMDSAAFASIKSKRPTRSLPLITKRTACEEELEGQIRMRRSVGKGRSEQVVIGIWHVYIKPTSVTLRPEAVNSTPSADTYWRNRRVALLFCAIWFFASPGLGCRMLCSSGERR